MRGLSQNESSLLPPRERPEPLPWALGRHLPNFGEQKNDLGSHMQIPGPKILAQESPQVVVQQEFSSYLEL